MNHLPAAAPTTPLEGGCDCRAVRYRMNSAPLIPLIEAHQASLHRGS